MNKNTVVFVLLLSIVINTIHCMDDQKKRDMAINALFTTAIVSGASYLMGKIGAKHLEKSLLDAPPNFQKWAREILANNGLVDANLIPLKVGTQSMTDVIGGLFIQFDPKIINPIEEILAGKSMLSKSQQKTILASAERTLLHEKKHYSNGDFGKECLSRGITAASTMIIIDSVKPEKNIHATIGASIVVLSSGFLIPNIPYIRYQEKEADRYAFMHLSSLENLELCKNFGQGQAHAFERNLLNNKTNDEDNFLQKTTSHFFAKQLKNINKSLGENADKPEVLSALQRKKRRYIEVASFLRDFEHYSWQSHVELAQECIDLRKKQEQDSNITPKDTEQDTFIFRDFAGI